MAEGLTKLTRNGRTIADEKWTHGKCQWTGHTTAPDEDTARRVIELFNTCNSVTFVDTQGDQVEFRVDSTSQRALALAATTSLIPQTRTNREEYTICSYYFSEQVQKTR